MTNKLLRQLVQISYKGHELDPVKVENIVHLLSRKELKQYIAALKAREKELTVEIALPDMSHKTEYARMFQNIFPDKKIRMIEDNDLLLGVRVTNNDLVYDMSFADAMQQVQGYIEKNF